MELTTKASYTKSRHESLRGCGHGPARDKRPRSRTKSQDPSVSLSKGCFATKDLRPNGSYYPSFEKMESRCDLLGDVNRLIALIDPPLVQIEVGRTYHALESLKPVTEVSLRVAVITFVIVIVVLFRTTLVFLFIFFLIWLLSQKNIDSYQEVRRA